jgi:DNA-binding MarR family transcriptional regulator
MGTGCEQRTARLGVSELARAMDIHRPTASIFVKALAARKLVTVRRTGQDRCAVQLYPTSESKEVFRRAPGAFAGVLPQAVTALDAQVPAQLETSLGALIRELGRR